MRCFGDVDFALLHMKPYNKQVHPHAGVSQVPLQAVGPSMGSATAL